MKVPGGIYLVLQSALVSVVLTGMLVARADQHPTSPKPARVYPAEDLGIMHGVQCVQHREAKGYAIKEGRDIGDFKYSMIFSDEVPDFEPQKVSRPEFDEWNRDQNGKKTTRKSKIDFEREKKAAQAAYEDAVKKSKDYADFLKLQAMDNAATCQWAGACAHLNIPAPQDNSVPYFCECSFADPAEVSADEKFQKALQEFYQYANEREGSSRPLARQAPTRDQFVSQCNSKQPGVGPLDQFHSFHARRFHQTSCRWTQGYVKNSLDGLNKLDKAIAEKAEVDKVRVVLRKLGFGFLADEKGLASRLYDGIGVGDSIVKLYNEKKINLVLRRGNWEFVFPGTHGDMVTFQYHSVIKR